jgi:hypothetical protein
MNEKHKSGGFRHRIYWYVLITAVIQFLLGIGFAVTAFARGPIALLFLIPMANFAYLLLILFQHGLSYTQYGTLIIVGTFFMFLMIVALGEIHHQIGKMIPSDPQEEARRHASHE